MPKALRLNPHFPAHLPNYCDITTVGHENGRALFSVLFFLPLDLVVTCLAGSNTFLLTARQNA
jgi:hypothetical protein